MKRKLAILIASVAMALCCALGLAACGEKQPPKAEWTVEAVYAHAQSLGYAGTLEEFLAQIQGADGADGVGVQSVAVDERGHLIVTLTNEKVIDCGKVTGADGQNGADGVSVQSVAVDERGHLIVTLTNKQVIDCGKVTGADGADGQNGADGVGVQSVKIDENGHLIVTLTNEQVIDCGSVRENATEQAEHPYFVISHGSIVGVTAAGRQQTSLTVPDEFGGEKITHIAPYALSDLSELNTLVISDGITDIGLGALSGCWTLERLTLPFLGANSRQVGATHLSYIFGEMTGDSGLVPATLREIVLTKGTSIGGESPFRSCENVTTLTLPTSLTRIENGAFDTLTALTQVHIQDLAAWCKIDFAARTLNGKTALLLNGEPLTALTLSDELPQINAYAFAGCSSLTSVTFGSGIASIGEGVFEGCPSLSSVNFGGVTSIGRAAFKNCTAFKQLTLSNSIASLNEGAFEGCSSLTSVTFGSGLTSIGKGAFAGCALKAITVDAGNATFHSNGNCLIQTENKQLALGCSASAIPTDGSVTSIGNAAFYGCTALTQVTIPKNVTKIWDNAFSDCTALKKLSIPESVKSMGNRAFENCSGLEYVAIEHGMTDIGRQAFKGCTALKSIRLPGSLKRIGGDAFAQCPTLEAFFYWGTKELWDTITIGYNNIIHETAHVYFFSPSNPFEGAFPVTEGYYWYFGSDAETPVIWTKESA